MAREMIDSGIEWVGDIPAKWGVYPARYAFSEIRTKNADGSITNALKFFNGTIIPKANFDADSDDYVAETITNYTIVEPDTIIINGLNLNYDLKSLRVGLVKETGVITSAYLALWPDKSRILPQYATYLFKGYETKMAFHNMGAGIRKTLGFKEFKRQPILIPEMVEQQRIVSFLDTECARIDAVIEKTRASIEEYKKLKQAVITQAVTKGIRSNRQMKDSGNDWIGEIPDDWDCTLLKRHCAFQTGSTPSTANEQWFNGDLDWFTPVDFNDKYYLIDSSRKLSLLAREDGVATMIPQNTVMIIGIGGTAGKIGYTTKECSCNQQITAIKADDEVCPKYLMYWMIANTTRLKDTALYTTLPIINNQTIGQYPFLVPATMEEQVEIADYLDSKVIEIETLVEKKERIILDIEKYKKSLIFEYVTGKKEVPA